MTSPNRLQQALTLIIREIVGGLRHGFFDFSIAGEKVRDGERTLTFKAGKSHRFRIPDHEYQDTTSFHTSDPDQEGATPQITHQGNQKNPDAAADGNDNEQQRKRPLGKAIRQTNHD